MSLCRNAKWSSFRCRTPNGQLSWESLFVTEITFKPRVTVQWNEDHLSLFLCKSPIISSPPHHPDAFSPLPLLLFSPSPSRRPSSFQNTLSFSSSLPVSRPTSHFPVRPSVYPSICHTWFVFKCRRSYQVQTCLLHHWSLPLPSCMRLRLLCIRPCSSPLLFYYPFQTPKLWLLRGVLDPCPT